MSDEVYANGREISSKSCQGKSVAAFPDVCFTPPQTPATPPGVPIPYPNTGMASDTSDGSKNVKISDKEVMLKNKSYFKKSSGDEAGCAPKKGVITSKIQGKIYFTSWSMDVKFEGENVVRHLDLTTHNHASPTPNSPPWVHMASQLFRPGGVCEGMDDLKLQPYKEDCPSSPSGERQTGHHLIPGRCLRDTTKTPNYNHDNAPVICVSFGNQHQGSHKACHAIFDPVEADHFDKNKPFKYEKACDTAAKSAGGAVDRELTGDEKKCVSAQLDTYYKKDPNGPKLDNSSELRASGDPGKVIPSSTSPSGGT